jgi:P22 coat protein - gene protein 5
MPNTILNPTVIAKAAVRILENELVMGRKVYRGYEEEFDKKINGYDVGDSISIRKPQQFKVRSGATVTGNMQDVTEGKLNLTVNKQKGVDFQFSSLELTLKIEDLADRVIRPALVRLANQVDADVMDLFTAIPNWVGQPATGADAPIDSFAKFARAAERLDQNACPQDMRSAVLAPDSYWALAGGSLGQFLPQVNQQSYRQGEIGTIGGVDTYMSQNVPTFVGPGNLDAPATVTGAQSVAYTVVANSDGTPGIWGPGVGGAGAGLVTGGWTGTTVKAGTVFTIGSAATAVRAVNPVTKAVLPFQQMFTVVTDATVTGGAATLTITPPIIPLTAPDGPQWGTTDIAAGAGATLQIVGDASGSYRQNMMFHRDAFALVMVPMVRPPGAVDVARESYKGSSVRLIPYYDGNTDISNYRLDVLYGIRVVDNRLAVRMSGGSATLGSPSL